MQDNEIKIRIDSAKKERFKKYCYDKNKSITSVIQEMVDDILNVPTGSVPTKVVEEIVPTSVPTKKTIVEVKENEGLKSLIETGLVSKGVKRGRKELPSQEIDELRTYFKK